MRSNIGSRIMRQLLALTLGASLATLAHAQNTTSNETCNTGIHMIVSRGSLEPAGTGRIGVVAGNVSEEVADSVIVPLTYPATFTNYSISEGNGTEALTDLIKSYVALCPDAKIALLGYSQGAQVTADTLCGTDDGKDFETTAALSSTYDKNIFAVVLFGDPSHTANASFNAGTSTRDGIFPRQNNSACEPYASKMRSWCDTGDIYCDSGNNTKTHGSYFANYTTAAVDFIVSKYNETLTGSSNGTDGGSSGGSSGSGSTGNSTDSGSSIGSSVSVSRLPALVGILIAILGPAALIA